MPLTLADPKLRLQTILAIRPDYLTVRDTSIQRLPSNLRAMLPKDEVKEGGEWDIEVGSLTSVLAPGGNLSIVPKDMEADQMAMGMPGMGSMSDWLRGSLEGSAKGKFVSTREVGGAKMAVLKITAKITVSKDMTDIVADAMKNAKLPPEAGGLTVDHMDIDY